MFNICIQSFLTHVYLVFLVLSSHVIVTHITNNLHMHILLYRLGI